MVSAALFATLKSVEQDNTQIHHDLTRGDTEAVIDDKAATRAEGRSLVLGH